MAIHLLIADFVNKNQWDFLNCKISVAWSFLTILFLLSMLCSCNLCYNLCHFNNTEQSYLAQAKINNHFRETEWCPYFSSSSYPFCFSLSFSSFLMFRFWQVAMTNAYPCLKAAEHTKHTQISDKITYDYAWVWNVPMRDFTRNLQVRTTIRVGHRWRSNNTNMRKTELDWTR